MIPRLFVRMRLTAGGATCHKNCPGNRCIAPVFPRGDLWPLAATKNTG